MRHAQIFYCHDKSDPRAYVFGGAAIVYAYLPFLIPLALAGWYLARHLTVAVGWR